MLYIRSMNMRCLFLLYFVLLSFSLKAQQGCTCVGALNYDPYATENDGSCVFTPYEYRPKVLCAIQSVPETSSLLYWNNRVWTADDSGGEPELYAIDTISGKTIQTVRLKGLSKADIVDWEEIAQDEEHIYIGDIGNNRGDRRNLCFYVVDKKDIDTKDNCTVPFRKLAFYYPEQQDFEKRNKHNFDAEAFFVWNDTLHLFSKNRDNVFTYHYTLPAVASEQPYAAKRVDSFEVAGMITGAALSPDKKEFALLGYYDLQVVFIWFFWDFQPGRFFTGNKRLIYLPEPAISGQTEGVTYRSNAELLLSNESNGTLSPSMLVSVLNKDISRMAKRYYQPEEEVYLQEHVLYIQAKEPSTLSVRYADGKEVFRQERVTEFSLDVSSWLPGLYKVSLQSLKRSSTQNISINE